MAGAIEERGAVEESKGSSGKRRAGDVQQLGRAKKDKGRGMLLIAISRERGFIGRRDTVHPSRESLKIAMPISYNRRLAKAVAAQSASEQLAGL